MTRLGMSWSDEDIALLSSLVREGVDVATIARRLQRSPAAVHGRARAMKIKVRRR
jgi:hypothetical protein